MKTSWPLTILAAGLRWAPFLGRELRLRTLGAAARWFESAVEVRFGPYIYRFDPSDYWQREMALNLYEPSVRERMRWALKRGDVVVDVGAQLGYFAATAATRIGPSGWLVLFEPDPRNLERLRYSVSSAPTGVGPRVIVLDQACSDREGTATLRLDETMGQARLGAGEEEGYDWRRDRKDEAGEKEIEVETARLDSALTRLGVERIRWLKMDVEGHEIPALEGLGPWLAERRVAYLLIECCRDLLDRQGLTPRHLYAAVARWGYAGVSLERAAPLTRRALEAGPPLENWLFGLSMDSVRRLWGSRRLGAGESERMSAEEIERLMEENRDAAAPARRGRRLVRSVLEGKPLAQAIDAAYGLLEETPDLDELRGHLAHWLAARGDSERAREQYRLLLARRPADTEAALRLARMGG